MKPTADRILWEYDHQINHRGTITEGQSQREWMCRVDALGIQIRMDRLLDVCAKQNALRHAPRLLFPLTKT